MYGKGADDFEQGLIEACKHGLNSSGIINFMIDHGASRFGTGLDFACKSGDLDTVKYMMNMGVKVTYSIYISACKGGNEQVMDYILERHKPYWLSSDIRSTILENPEEVFLATCESGNLELLMKYLPAGKNLTNKSIFLSRAIMNISISGNLEALAVIDPKNKDPESRFLGACEGGHLELAKKSLESMPLKNSKTNKDLFFRALQKCCVLSSSENYLEIIKFLHKNYENLSHLSDRTRTEALLRCADYNQNIRVINYLIKCYYHPFHLPYLSFSVSIFKFN